jgi:putative membrane protein
MNPLHWLFPWEFSSSVMVCCTAAVILFARGSRRESGCAATTSRWREVSFYLGIMLIYVPRRSDE